MNLPFGSAVYPARVARAPLRVLLTEGASTSAREAVTALGLAGHHVEVMDPSGHGLTRFSRFVQRFHRCPPLGTEPEGFRDFLLALVADGEFDVVLPIHEQGYLLARISHLLKPHVAVALPAFAAYERAISRTGFARLLRELCIPRPCSEILSGPSALGRIRRFPCVVKAEIGTASRTVWMIANEAALARATPRIAAATGGTLLVQEHVSGPVEHAQAVFQDGQLVAMHGYRQLGRGAGGGPALKESVIRSEVRTHLARIGRALDWHGALSVDYILRGEDGRPVYIDCNPRLVEPMSAALAGLDLLDVLLGVSMGEQVPSHLPARSGTRTRLGLQALLGLGLNGASRRRIICEAWMMALGCGAYRDSCEELTPVTLDARSLLPLTGAAAALLASPKLAERLASRGWGAHLLTPEAMRQIRSWPAPTEAAAQHCESSPATSATAAR